MSSKYSGDKASDVDSWFWLVAGLIAGMILSPLISSCLPTWKSSLKSMFETLLDQLGHRERPSSMVNDSASAHFLDSNIREGFCLIEDEDSSSSSYHSVDSNISEVSSLCEEDIAPVQFQDSNNSEECVDSHKQVYRYDVFLSFRGPDVRNNFVDHLFERLTKKGIFTFKDNVRLKRGKRVKPELMDAIRDSRLAIVVFSSTYPTSTWCLDEMSAIADLHRQKKQIVVPVFCGITSSDVGRRGGPYDVHFNSEQYSKIPNRVDRWKFDAKYLAKVNGFPINPERPETKQLEEIIAFVTKELNHKFTIDISDLIGIQPRVADLERRLKLTSEDVPFQILEILGMSGIGKTVLAKILFDRISYQFDACCFIQDVNHIHKMHGRGATTKIQKQIIHQLFQEEDLQFLSSPEIVKMLQNRLCNPNLPKRALIVLDDVDDPNQWHKLGILPNFLGAGSRVVITTRFEHILNVNTTAYEIYEAPLLNDDDALKLFLTKVSKSDYPSTTVSGVSHKIIEYAQRLPSAIEKLASSFHPIGEELWERELVKWRKYPNERFMKSLQETSYDELNRDEKVIFLDIACFFGGKRKKYVEHILGTKMSDPYLAIQEIRRKSLITIRNHEIHMHQMLRELGKNIVRDKYPEEPKYWSRLWDVEDFQKVLMSDMEANKVQTIVLDDDVSKHEDMKIEGLSNMRDLRLLILHHKSSSENLTFRFNELYYLLWHGYSSTSLSLSIWYNLVELNLINSRIQQLWEGSQAIPNLKKVDLSNSKNLKEMPSFEGCRGLVRLDLSGCTNLTKVHESIGLLKELDCLSLQDCTSLALLDFGTNCQLRSLRTLLLSGCTKLEHTPDLSGLSNLRYLDLERCTNLSTVHRSIGEHATLKYLSLRGCINLVHPPDIVNGNSSLLILDLSGCMRITNLLCRRRKFAPSSCLESLIFLSSDFLEPTRTLDFVAKMRCLERPNPKKQGFSSVFDRDWLCSKLTYLNLAYCHELRRFPELSFHGLHEMKGTLERYPQLSIIGQDYIFSASTV
ncbi:disease resistance protein RPV1-like isoform X2 [Arachis stenosperma]|uniref:disease resistance protein RPV1-like isoform X2 n=1 Tax=Arachis stenosperma TaxID=217475 RepID=UPI0025ABE3EB|nr:disease resistance protein RPV1-like isoform X2 [Arachis stenosperma]